MAKKKETKKESKMTKLRLLKPWADYSPGDSVTLADDFAVSLIKRKMAEPLVTA